MFDPARGYPTVVPYVRYVDPSAAARWLTEVLGAREALRMTLPDGRIGHVELMIGDAALSLGLAAAPPVAAALPSRTTLRAMTLVFVDDVDEAVRRAIGAGGALVDEPTDQPWGLQQASVADPEGHLWEPSTHVWDVPVERWGATVLGPITG